MSLLTEQGTLDCNCFTPVTAFRVPRFGQARLAAIPDFSSAQAVPGSAVAGNSLYLCIGAARILAKMVPPGLSSGKHSGET
ncbi:MAG: hypothetical protein CSA32_04045 [Desulfobulbus propionicus]|nr:MAG: hypothetical protein CSA32_04045 [Desulfobulbus propionicus]